jgi:hypothetical protein
MARNWMVNPKIHCRKHLLGAHVECHIFCGILRNKKKIDGYIKNNCLEISNLIFYHNLLALEMLYRGYNHNSNIEILPNLSHIPEEYKFYTIDRESALADLLNRCDSCRQNYERLYNSLNFIFI